MEIKQTKQQTRYQLSQKINAFNMNSLNKTHICTYNVDKTKFYNFVRAITVDLSVFLYNNFFLSEFFLNIYISKCYPEQGTFINKIYVHNLITFTCFRFIE